MDLINIAHITDLHIVGEGKLNHGIDVRKNFKNILDDILQDDTVHQIIVGGDLLHEASDTAYYPWIKKQLEKTGIPYRIIPGNHDDSKSLAKSFGLNHELKDGKLIYFDELDFGKIIYADTSTGDLSIEQLVLIEEECSNSYQKFLLFIHHPPVEAEVPFMDKNHALVNMDEVQKTLRKINNIQGIFCGHYHNDRLVRFYNHIILITPSTFAQISDKSDKLDFGSNLIGWRKIVWDGSYLSTFVKYL